MSDAFAQSTVADAARLQASAGPPKDPRPKAANADDNERNQFLDVRELRTQYLDYLTTKVDEIDEQKTSRHYYHGAQYTPEQIETLRQRRQPYHVWNRTAQKINGIIGVVERIRSDPKALPRNVRSEQGANIATQTIREVLEANDWKGIEPWCLLQCAIDGVAGVQRILIKGDKGDPDVQLSFVIGDEYFYDPKSYLPNFQDVRYEGVSKWLDIDAAIELFPDKEEELRGLLEGDADLTTNADREYKWVMSSAKRVRLIEHWYKHRGNWCWSFYVSTTLLDQGISPWYDDKGKTCRSYDMFSVAVDHDGDRYGFCRNLKGPQDSLNQSKSKSLHIANSRRVIADKGAVDDVQTARIEYARPDGWIEKNPNFNIQPEDKAQDLTSFIQFGQEAGNEIDKFADVNVAALQGSQITNISGRAIEMLRQPGMAQLGPFMLSIRQWKLAIYRGIWNAAQRYWTSERWIRVNSDDDKVLFMQLNGLTIDPWGRPMIVNKLGALDVDIILEEGPDVASAMSDTYDMLRGFPPGTFPPQLLIELNPNIPRSEKKRLLQMMAPKPPPPAAQTAAKLELDKKAADVAKAAADARKSDAAAAQSYAKAGQIGGQTALDAAQFQHGVFMDMSQITQPPQQPQPGPARPPQAPGAPQLPFPLPQG